MPSPKTLRKRKSEKESRRRDKSAKRPSHKRKTSKKSKSVKKPSRKGKISKDSRRRGKSSKGYAPPKSKPEIHDEYDKFRISLVQGSHGTYITVPYRRVVNILYNFVNGVRYPHPIETDRLLIFSAVENYRYPSVNTPIFGANQRFIDSLSTREIAVLSGYTNTGDRLINAYMRNNPNFNQIVLENLTNPYYEIYDKLPGLDSPWKQVIVPIYYQLLDKFPNMKGADVNKWLQENSKNNPNFYRIVRKCVEDLIYELLTIFAKVPPLQTDLTVFRGTQTLYVSENLKNFTTTDFMSTTFNPFIALTRFSSSDCCLTQFNLKAGTRTIFMEPVTQSPTEMEFLLPPQQKFTIIKRQMKTIGRPMKYIIMDGV